MFDKIELFNRAVCFTPIWALIDLLFVAHFFLSWYRSSKKTKWKIDFWYLTLFLIFFPSLFLLYPFNASIYNDSATMGLQSRIVPFIDRAFFISLLGYFSVWLGRYLFDFTQGSFPLAILFKLTRPFSEIVENNIKSKRACLFITFTAIVLGFLILAIQFKAGCFFNARGWFLKEPLLRPVFNLTISVFSIAFSFLSLRYIQFKEKNCLGLIFILLLFTIFFGVRSLGLSGLLYLFIQWIYYREGQYSFVKLAGIFLGLFFIAVFLEHLRQGEFHALKVCNTFLTKLFYGNNFSDNRDFAWILSYWDGEYLYGKTYVAALLSFIPRAFSSIREEWSIFMYTNELTGFDSGIMPGLRPGVFGEAFLNFSYPGVMIFGLLFGFAMRYGDLKIKEYVMQSKDIIKGYSHLFAFSILSSLSITAGMWSLYVFLLLNLFVVLIRGRTTTSTETFV